MPCTQGLCMNILLTGVRAPVALDWAFRLHRSGARVFMADSLRLPIGRFSPHCAGYTQTPPPAPTRGSPRPSP